MAGSAFQAQSSPAAYRSATLPNLRETLSLLGLSLVVILALGLPWLLVYFANMGGLNLDTWKPMQGTGGMSGLLPQPAREYKETEQGLLALYGAGVWAMASEFDTPQAAVQEWRRRWRGSSWPSGVRSASTVQGDGQWLVFAHVSDGRLLEWVNGKYIIAFFAPDDVLLGEIVRVSPMIDAPPEPGFGKGDAPLRTRLFRHHALATALWLDGIVLLGVFLVVTLAMRRQRLGPMQGVTKVGLETMRNRLLALNSVNTPVVLEEQAPYHLILRLKLEDPQFLAWLRKAGLERAWQFDLYLNSSQTAAVLETWGVVKWSGDDQAVAPVVKWNYWRSLSTTVSSELAQPDVEGLSLPVHSLRFEDYGDVIRKVLLGSGWTVQPLLFRPLLWDHR